MADVAIAGGVLTGVTVSRSLRSSRNKIGPIPENVVTEAIEFPR